MEVRSEGDKDNKDDINSATKPKERQGLGSYVIKYALSVKNIINIIFNKNHDILLLKSLNNTLDKCYQNKIISAEERKMVKNIINIDDIKVDNVMTPRTDIFALNNNASLDEIKRLITNSEHSRIPIFKENLDTIIGFIHSKDLVNFIKPENDQTLDEEINNFRISDITRKIIYVPRSMRIIDLLLRMRSSRVHIAIVLDEYGGTDGLVTIEDIVEEIVGEIEDEHDSPDDNIYFIVNKLNHNTLQVGGRVEIDKILDFFDGKISKEESEGDFDTVGGLIFAIFKKVPEIGEVFNHNSGISFKILDADARSVKLVEIIKN